MERKMTQSQPRVSVIIPTLNRDAVLTATLDDVLKQMYPDFEVIVVDQSDEVAESVRRYLNMHPDVIFLQLEEKGTPNAKNVGADRATGEIFVFLDDDVRIASNRFLLAHVANYADPAVGGVGGRVTMDGDPPPETIADVGKFRWFGLKEVTNFSANFRTDIDHVYGCNQSFRREAFERAGGFQKVYKGNAHLEEADVSFRVRRAGYRIVFDPNAVLHHLYFPSGGTRTKDVYELRYWLVHNGTVFYLRHYGWLLFPLFFLKQLGWAIGSGLKRGDGRMVRVILSAVWAGIQHYRSNKLRVV
ncbi:MAG: glycosyltransferase family 2 protein [Patescibacteria group bacterium]|jgi:GT2 family glycosyltransferase